MLRYALALACLLPAIAQTSDTAAIHGRVLDQTRAGIPNATVTITNRRANFERKVETNGAGMFVVSGLTVSGAYTFTASKQGFLDAKLGDVLLAAGVAA